MTREIEKLYQAELQNIKPLEVGVNHVLIEAEWLCVAVM